VQKKIVSFVANGSSSILKKSPPLRARQQVLTLRPHSAPHTPACAAQLIMRRSGKGHDVWKVRVGDDQRLGLLDRGQHAPKRHSDKVDRGLVLRLHDIRCI
jgi:hypothetical protein